MNSISLLEHKQQKCRTRILHIYKRKSSNLSFNRFRFTHNNPILYCNTNNNLEKIDRIFMAFVAMRVRNNTFAAICTGLHTLLLSLCAYNITITNKHIMCNCIHNS